MELTPPAPQDGPQGEREPRGPGQPGQGEHLGGLCPFGGSRPCSLRGWRILLRFGAPCCSCPGGERGALGRGLGGISTSPPPPVSPSQYGAPGPQRVPRKETPAEALLAQRATGKTGPRPAGPPLLAGAGGARWGVHTCWGGGGVGVGWGCTDSALCSCARAGARRGWRPGRSAAPPVSAHVGVGGMLGWDSPPLPLGGADAPVALPLEPVLEADAPLGSPWLC